MKWIVVAAAVAAVLVAVALAVGTALPVHHTASSSIRLPVSRDVAWSAVTDIRAFPLWRRGVRDVEPLPFRDGLPAWRERTRTGSATYVAAAWDPPSRLVMRTGGEGEPYSGTWTFVLEKEGGDTRITITEDGEIPNPLFRFMARFVFGHEGTMDAYLHDLRRHLSRSLPRAEA